MGLVSGGIPLGDSLKGKNMSNRYSLHHAMRRIGVVPWFALGILVLMFLQTGALALMTLMLTGVVRGGTVTTAISYQDFIETVIWAQPTETANERR